MKANEFMIGDWVNTKRGHARIIYIGKYSGIYTDNKNEGEVLYSPCELNPIPLTAEILEKNGFKFQSPCINDNKDAWVYEWPNEKPYYTPHAFLLMSHHNKAEFPNFWICAPNNPDIVYVHQLQHALRLCGIEKEIEL